jgi:prophage regulatory protein
MTASVKTQKHTLVQYTVTATLSNPKGQLPYISNAMKAIILANLGGRRPVLGYSDDVIIATCDLLAADTEMAITMVKTYIDDALRAAELPPLVLVAAEARPTADYESAAGDLMGLAEVAHECGLSRQRAFQLSKSDDFPATRANLAAGPVWRRRDIARWWQQRQQTKR